MTDGKINEKHTDSAISTAYISNNSYRKSSIIIGKNIIINMKEITGQSDISRESRQSIYIGCQRDICPYYVSIDGDVYTRRQSKGNEVPQTLETRGGVISHARSTSFRFFDDISFFASCLHTHTHARAPIYRSVGYATTKSYQENNKKKSFETEIQYRSCALRLIFIFFF